MDQFDRAQLDGIGAGPEFMRDILLLDAVCGVHGSGRNGRLTRRYLSHWSSYRQFNYHSTQILPRGYSTHVTRRSSGFTGHPHPHHHTQGHLRGMDDLLFNRITHLELRPPSLLILAFRRFLMG